MNAQFRTHVMRLEPDPPSGPLNETFGLTVPAGFQIVSVDGLLTSEISPDKRQVEGDADPGETIQVNMENTLITTTTTSQSSSSKEGGDSPVPVGWALGALALVVLGRRWGSSMGTTSLQKPFKTSPRMAASWNVPVRRGCSCSS